MTVRHYVFVLFIIFISLLHCVTINVPDDYTSIQAAINASSDGDIVLVQPGTYYENINYNGKNITVASLFYITNDESYISQTIIDGSHNGSVVIFTSGESITALLDGFTIKNGYTGSGGGVLCNGASPTIRKVIITNNTASSYGGGVALDNNSDPNIENVTIINNVSYAHAAGIFIDDNSNPNITNVIIKSNTASSMAGGIYCKDSSPFLTNVLISNNEGNTAVAFKDYATPSLINVTITENIGDGVDCSYSANPSLENCIVWNNTENQVVLDGYISGDINSITIAYSDIQGGEEGIVIQNNNGIVNWNEGNMDTDPLFVDALNGDSHLLSGSPCINSGNPDSGCNDPDGSLNDIGNYGGPFANITLSANAGLNQTSFINDLITLDGSGSSYQNGNILTYHWYQDINNPEIVILSENNSPTAIKPTFSSSLLGEYIFSLIVNDGNNNSVENSVKVTLVNNTINIPADYSTIQEGLNNALENSEVIVAPGTYYENIKWPATNGIKLRGSGEDDCIIDGSQRGSVIGFENWLGEVITESTLIKDFTIKNGNRGIYIECPANPRLENLKITDNFSSGIYCEMGYHKSMSILNVNISNNTTSYNGGGINCFDFSLILENVILQNNSAGEKGGGIYCECSEISLENVTIKNNSAEESGGGIYQNDFDIHFSNENLCNIYSNTLESSRGFGADIFINCCYETIDVIVDTFTVMNPNDYYSSPIEHLNFYILHSVEDNLINADIYVSPDGDNTNSGISSYQPVKTINHALKIIYADYENINTIHLSEGIYSPLTNGESFPINWSNYVNLSGSNQETTILDANFTSSVMIFYNVNNSYIRDLTISNGDANSSSGPSDDGGGIYLDKSSPTIENVTITNNSADYGGGILCWVDSDPTLENVTISNNTADRKGGGIYCLGSDISLKKVLIFNNSADEGGGIHFYAHSNPILEYATITDNSAQYGGGIYCWFATPILDNCILWYNSSHEIYINSSGSVTATYSDIAGGWVGTGNIDSDPFFVDATSGDYNLTVNSPCIDSGDPNSPLDPDGTRADMGAFCYHQDEPPLPTILSSFTAIQSQTNAAAIQWTTQSESGLLGFTLYKEETANQQFAQMVNLSPIPAGNTSQAQTYSYSDDAVTEGKTYYYWLEAVALDGSSESFGPVLLTISEPGTAPPSPAFVTKLCTAYPNPFNPSTSIPFSLKEPSHVKIEVFNTAGQKIQTLTDNEYTEGEHQIVWDGTNSTGSAVSSGIYLYRMNAGTYTDVQKVILMK